MKRELQEQIQPLTAATNEMKRQNELAQERNSNNIQMMNASYENIMTEMRLNQQAIMNPLTEQTQELKNIHQFEEERHKQTMALKDAVKETMIIEFKSQILHLFIIKMNFYVHYIHILII